MFYPFISYIPASLGFLLLGSLTFLKNTQAWINRYFAIFTLCGSAWLALFFVTDTTGSPKVSLWAFRAAVCISTLAAPFFLLFTERFPLYKPALGKNLKLGIATLTGLLMGLAFTPWFIPRVNWDAGNVQPTGLGIIYIVQTIFILGCFAGGYFVLKHKGARLTKLQKRQIRLVSNSMAATFVVNALNSLVLTTFGASGRYADLVTGLSLFLFASVTAYTVAMTQIVTNVQTAVKKSTLGLKKTNAELKRLDSLKDDFMAMASHQLRSPATSVQEALQMLSYDSLSPEERKRLVALAEASSQRLVGVVKTMMNIDKLKSSQLGKNKVGLDFAVLARKTAASAEMQAKQKGIRLILKLPKTPVKTRADKVKIGEAMTNLVENAIKYSPNDSTATVRVKHLKTRFVFEVCDNGIGVPGRDRAKLFTKFYRASNAGKVGSGVGLFVVKNVAEAHGGQAYYKPLKRGSLLGFWIPNE